MMRPDHSSVRLGLSIPSIDHPRRQCTTATCPVEVRDSVEIFVKGGLGLLVDDAEDLVDSSKPW